MKYVDQKIRPIPPLVLASKAENVSDRYDILYLHPATEPLVSRNHINAKKLVFCSSNEISATQVFHQKGNNVAITNSIAAEAMNLEIITILRPAHPMGRVLFEQANNDNK